MTKHVYANGMAIACGAGSGKVVAAFPSVCQSPPAPPTGPIPVPYALSSFSRDLKGGSKRVKIGAKPVALHGQSYYQTRPLGNEAATRSFGASIVTRQVIGRTQFEAGSIDVKFEGRKVCRHLDLTSSNHGSEPGEGQSPGLEGASPSTKETFEIGQCPCCEKEMHPNQYDPVTREPYETIDEAAWYQAGFDKAEGVFRKKTTPEGLAAIRKHPPDKAEFIIGEIHRKYGEAVAAMAKLREAWAGGLDCENLHPPGSGCATYFKKTNAEPSTSTAKGRRIIGFNEAVARECRMRWREKGYDWVEGSEIVHMTPLAAGGCPSGKDNLVPKGVLKPKCLDLDKAQTKIQDYVSFVRP